MEEPWGWNFGFGREEQLRCIFDRVSGCLFDLDGPNLAALRLFRVPEVMLVLNLEPDIGLFLAESFGNLIDISGVTAARSLRMRGNRRFPTGMTTRKAAATVDSKG